MQKSEEVPVACSFTNDFVERVHGSEDGKCADCGKSIIVSPSSRELVRSGKATKLSCFPCVFDQYGSEPMILKVDRTQVSELEEHFAIQQAAGKEVH